MPDGPFPPVASLDLGSPPSQVLLAATTPSTPSRWAPVSLVHRYPPAISFLRSRRELTASGRRAWSLFTPGPLPGLVGGRVLGLPSSRVAPVETCPALGPRWCPDWHRRLPVGMLPSAQGSTSAHPRLQPDFGAQYRGLSPRSSWLRTADCSAARRTRYRPAGGLWPGGTAGPYIGSGTHWATLASFM